MANHNIPLCVRAVGFRTYRLTHTQRQRNLNDPERKLEIWIKIWSLAFVIVDVFRQLAQGQRVARSFAALGGFQKNCGFLDLEEVNSIAALAASKAWFVFKNRLEQNHSGKDLMDVLLLKSPLAASSCTCTVPPRHDLLLLGRGSGPVLLHAAPWILKDGMAWLIMAHLVKQWEFLVDLVAKVI